MKKRVLVAMSGGLDSSMAALILHREGYEVIGVTMSIWNDEYLNKGTSDMNSLANFQNGCLSPTEKDDILSAKEICEQIGARHYLIDLQKEFKEIVLNYFQNDYLQGMTPNPCVICNKRIKFGVIPDRMKEMGISFDYYATGHYARIIKKASQEVKPNEATNNLDNPYIYIRKAKDDKKDQSYFLSMLQQKQLHNLLLPLGDLTKEEIKEMAYKEGLGHLAERKESQDFIDNKDYESLFTNGEGRPGPILDKDRNQIGKHKGIIYYTIGKRRGLNLSGLAEPYYVTAIDAKKNTIYAGPKAELYRNKLITTDVVWADEIERKGSHKLSAKIRLHHQQAECMVSEEGRGRYEVIFNEEQMAITPGQIIAFYEEDRIVGGGVIQFNDHQESKES